MKNQVIKLPKARTDLLVQDLNNEVLIYDLSNNKSYCLNETARKVFNACDGKKSFADVKLPEEVIYLSLDELKKQNLIEDDYFSPLAGINRRELIRKVGLSCAVALPVVTGLLAPTAMQAQSGCTGTNGAGAAVCYDNNADCQARARTLCASCSANFTTGDPTCFQFNAVGGRCECT